MRFFPPFLCDGAEAAAGLKEGIVSRWCPDGELKHFIPQSFVETAQNDKLVNGTLAPAGLQQPGPRILRAKDSAGLRNHERTHILTQSHVLYAILMPHIRSRASVRKQERARRPAAPQLHSAG